MKSKEQLIDDLVDDAFDTCLNDSSYMLSILQSYFKGMTEEQLQKMHSDAFENQD